MTTLQLIPIWLLNGTLSLGYLALDHLLLLVLCPALIWLGVSAPPEQHARHILIGSLALLTAAVAPTPVPLLLLVLALTGIAAIPFEHFNPPALRWTIARGLGLYSLIGLAFTGYQLWLASLPAGGDTLLERGQTYVSAIAGIAVYAFPLGVLGWLARDDRLSGRRRVFSSMCRHLSTKSCGVMLGSVVIVATCYDRTNMPRRFWVNPRRYALQKVAHGGVCLEMHGPIAPLKTATHLRRRTP